MKSLIIFQTIVLIHTTLKIKILARHRLEAGGDEDCDGEVEKVAAEIYRERLENVDKPRV